MSLVAALRRQCYTNSRRCYSTELLNKAQHILGHQIPRPRRHFKKGPLQRVDNVADAVGRALTWLLRHAAPTEGIPMRPDGYVRVEDVFRHPRFTRVPQDLLLRVVRNNPMQRFGFRLDPRTGWMVRSTAHHSIQFVNPAMRMISSDDYPELVYACDASQFERIEYTGIPPSEKGLIWLDRSTTDDVGVQPYESTITFLIVLDVSRMIRAGMTLFKYNTGRIVTLGNEDGRIPLEYAKRVTRIAWDKEVLSEDGDYTQNDYTETPGAYKPISDPEAGSRSCMGFLRSIDYLKPRRARL